MGHHHDHAPANYRRAFALGMVLNVGYILIEVGFGLASNSLALLADAGHNLSDVLGLGLAWAAHHLSQIKPSQRRTYGWRSSTILAALFNSLILLIAVGGIVWEALRRFGQPASISAGAIIWVAALGVAVNTLTAVLFYRGRKRDLNIEGAFLHMAADAAVSLGVVLAGVGIHVTGWAWIDPLTSLIVALVIFLATWQLLAESANLVLHAVPQGIRLDEVRRLLRELPGVESLHDLHVWAMSTTETALTAHLVKPAAGDDDALLMQAAERLYAEFGIEHVTLQIERSPLRCPQAVDGSV